MANDETNLGRCCACRGTANVRTMVAIERLCPTPGKGWGCFTCDLPSNGAMAVLCGPCVEGYAAGTVTIREVCTGYPATDGRTPIEELSAEVFDHDMSKHREEQAELN